MSDLKHKTAAELREDIARVSAYRAKLLREAEQFEAEAARLIEAAKRKRMNYNGQGEREAWARIYLARKTGDE